MTEIASTDAAATDGAATDLVAADGTSSGPAPAACVVRDEARLIAAAREDALLAALREATGVASLSFDDDRDVGLCYGELAVLVRVVGEPPRVRIHAVALEAAEADVELFARLNELNAQPGAVRWVVTAGLVVAVAEIPAAPLVAEHVAQALHAFCTDCEGAARALRAEFGAGAVVVRRGAARVLH